MEERELTEEEKRALLKVARSAVISSLKGEASDIGLPGALEGLNRRCGAFVTIHKHGALRGCIGNFTSDKPLYETVAEMARSAAFSDPRFLPLTLDEVADIDFEISVLSSLRAVRDLNEIEVGRHGIYITKGFDRGVLLPQVATEYGWDRETFLSHTCLKAGLPSDEWKKDVVIEIFSAEVFGEKQLAVK